MVENNKQKYKVLITTSGIGSRLGELTKYTNKSLVRIGKKPTLSYIIESYPEEIPIIITVGYFGNHVKDFVTLVYPERNIEFVEVDNYDNKGSSLGYSMLQAKDKLQCPFIYHAGDTITYDKAPEPDYNWIAGFSSDDSSHYATLNVAGNKVISINDKGAQDFDYIHIGIIGINNYSGFWDTLYEVYNENKNDSALNDVSVINRMIKERNESFEFVKFDTWLDIGNTNSLRHARKNIKDNDGVSVLDKNNESIFIFDNFVVKFFYDKKNIEERVARAKSLIGLIPEIEEIKENFYRYKYADGEIYSRTVRPSNFLNFLDWIECNLWKDVNHITKEEFKNNCHDFYYNKTIKRIDQMIEQEQIKDKVDIINGEKIPTIKDLLSMIDFDYLSDSEQSQFHGDFILDNIIDNDGQYSLIDWRQNFGGHLYSGDKYYDLAKLNHNLTVNHDIIKDNLFTIDIMPNSKIYCDIMRRENLVSCQKVYHEFLIDRGYDMKKINILTAIIWLNMSPLHHHPFNLFLYYFGKLNLWRSLQKK